MITEILPAEAPDSMLLALEILRNGGLVAFPTDTVYGLGAMAFSGAAVENLYTVKDRPGEKAIPVLIGEVDDLKLVSAEVPEIALKLAARFWPGPLTLVVPKNTRISKAVSEGPAVGVRFPDHPMARSLLRSAGPLAVTSANLSGQPSANTAMQVYTQLRNRIPLILDGGTSPGGVPSTVVDCTVSGLKILRIGPISESEILKIVG